MDAEAFATLAHRIAGRRSLIGRMMAATAALLLAPRAAAQSSPVAPCQQVGITGGGVVRLSTGEANLVLFASRLASGDAAPNNGVVRWQDPNHEGGLLLESIGPLVYRKVEGDQAAREVSGLCRINGEMEEPFVLLASDVGAESGVKDRCRLAVGDRVGDGAGTGWGYEAEGELVGGDLVLIQD
ncbi:MAG: hypothetical protein IT337_02060 [Thermomicrobiales bacterium]|nr:hypothetical protein [Thermomicrobiales bacterium]